MVLKYSQRCSRALRLISPPNCDVKCCKTVLNLQVFICRAVIISEITAIKHTSFFSAVVKCNVFQTLAAYSCMEILPEWRVFPALLSRKRKWMISVWNKEWEHFSLNTSFVWKLHIRKKRQLEKKKATVSYMTANKSMRGEERGKRVDPKWGREGGGRYLWRRKEEEQKRGESEVWCKTWRFMREVHWIRPGWVK